MQDGISSSVHNLQLPTALDIGGCRLDDHPTALWDLKCCPSKDADDTSVACLSDKKLTEIPEEVLLKCGTINILDISRNPGICLLNVLRQFTNVRKLVLHHNNLSEIPNGLCELAKLEELDLSWNNFSTGWNPEMGRLSSLRKLTMCHCGILSIGDWLDLEKLEELDLSSNNFEHGLDDAIRRARKLKVLMVSRCRLTSLPDWLGDLELLEELNISDNDFSMGLNATVRQLKQLRKLSVHYCELTNLSGWIGDLEVLEELDISGNDFGERLEPAIFRLQRLKKLKANHCKITTLPESVKGLTALEELDLSGNTFSHGLNPAIGLLFHLRKLRLRYCAMTTLPKELQYLKQLEKLDLTGNEFSDGLDSAIGLLYGLRKLKLVCCEIRSVPEWLGDLKLLEELDLSRNNFSEGLGTAISRLHRLRILSLHHCEMATLPEWLGELELLEELDLSRNKFAKALGQPIRQMRRLRKLTLVCCELTALPDWLRELEMLEEIDLSGNTIADNINQAVQPLSRLPRVKLHYSDVETHHDSLEEMKLNSQAIHAFWEQIDEILMKINSEIGYSSYYFNNQCELIVHPQESQDCGILRARLCDLIEKRGFQKMVKFVVAENPLFAMFCFVVEDGHRVQNIGMYLLENNSVFWLSTAHALVSLGTEKWFSINIASKELHVGSIGPLYVRFPPNGRCRLPTPYVGFSQRASDYMIDIMAGPVMLSCANSPLNPQFFLSESNPHINAHIYPEWCGATVMNIPSIRELALVQLVPLKLVCYSWVTSEVLEGRVYGISSMRFNLDKSRPTSQTSKAIFIASSNSVKPREGHSGCVWVTYTAERGFVAVAITNGYTDSGLWITTPLCSSLRALRGMFPSIFKADEHFQGYGLFLPRDCANFFRTLVS